MSWAMLLVFVLVAGVVTAAVLVVGRMLSTRETLPIARGKALDAIGWQFGVKRRRWESDAAYRDRIHATTYIGRRR